MAVRHQLQILVAIHVLALLFITQFHQVSSLTVPLPKVSADNVIMNGGVLLNEEVPPLPVIPIHDIQDDGMPADYPVEPPVDIDDDIQYPDNKNPYEAKPEEVDDLHLGITKRKVSGNMWPLNRVPYEIDTVYGARQRGIINQAINIWAEYTCVTFEPKTSRDTEWLYFTSNLNAGCSSFVGYNQYAANQNNGRQTLLLHENFCFSKVGTASHEIGHALGLIHEHARKDRDEHVKIYPSRIYSRSLNNFLIDVNQNTLNVPYDLASIMHYAPETFSNFAGLPVMTAKNGLKQGLMGQRDALGYYDILAINRRYNCGVGCSNQCDNDGYPLRKNGRCICVCPEGLTGTRCERVDTPCGGIIRLGPRQNETITSPNFPRQYSNQKCTWLISAPADSILGLTIDDLNITSLSPINCVHKLEVRNNLLGQRGDIYCGAGTIKPITTRADHNNNQMIITLDSTDRSKTAGTGFSATVRVIKDECIRNPCTNLGKCVPLGERDYRCDCPVGYIGKNCEKIGEGELVCTFGDMYCNMRNDDMDDLDFLRMHRNNKYLETFQGSNNSDGNTFFMGVPVEFRNTKFSEKARLVSPIISRSAGVPKRCFSFSYHMSGNYRRSGHVRAIMVNVVTGLETQLFKKTGQQPNGWHTTQHELTNTNDYYIYIEVQTNSNSPYNSLVGIDDISILPRSCRRSPCDINPCQNEGSQCIEESASAYHCLCSSGWAGRHCEYYDVNGFQCEFEEATQCGWENDKTADYIMMYKIGKADRYARTGPLVGSGGHGYYMLADASMSTAAPGKKARYMSPPLGHIGKLCLSFEYFMKGLDRTGLHNMDVKLRVNGRLQSTALFSKRGHQAEHWMSVNQELDLSTRNTQVVFEVTCGTKHTTDVAFDNVKFEMGGCYQAPRYRSSLDYGADHPRIQSADAQTTTTARTTTTTPTTTTTTPTTTPTPTTTTPTTTTTTTPRTTTRATTSTRRASRRSQARPLPQPLPTNGQVQKKLSRSGDILASCNFETDFCQTDMVDISPRPEKWIRSNDGTPSVRTGPTHAASGDWFIHIEASDMRAGHTSVLSSHQLLNSHGDGCVEFEYHMFGRRIGSLNVYSKKDGEERQLVWTIQGQQGSSQSGAAWQHADINVRMVGWTQIIFEAVRGSGYDSDVSLDNIIIRRGRCTRKEINSRNSNENRNSNLTPRFSHSCDFEGQHTCLYRQSANDNFDWTIGEGKTPSINTGPETAFSGLRYIYLEGSSPRNADDKAILESPIVAANSGLVCVTYSVHMHGAGIGSLRVYQQQLAGEKTSLGSLERDQGNRWVSVSHQLQNSQHDYQIIFEGQLGSPPYYSDIAMDKITVASGNC